MRKLASIKKIGRIEPIPNADKIELAYIGGWPVVVAKNVGHQTGNLVVYCEIDSFLPIEPEFEFLRKSSYKKLSDGTEGFRLKTIKLRGQISQGLILPLDDAIAVMKRRNGEVYSTMLEEGQDVSELLGIVKYEPPVPAQLAGKIKGYFPGFIPKTDEERIQNLTTEFEKWKTENHRFYVTEKLDGSSVTFYLRGNAFGVCSRNLELLEDETNSFWKVARELNIEAKMRAYSKNIAIQGELIGEGIQKNPYKLKGQTVRFFNVFDIDTQTRMNYDAFQHIIVDIFALQTVPVCAVPGFKLLATVDDMLELANGYSQLNNSTQREGVVIRSHDNKISFKVISNNFLLSE